MNELLERIVKLEAEFKSFDKRMSAFEKLADSVHKLAVSVSELTIRQQATADKVDELTTDVAEIKMKPARHWEAIVSAIIAALAGGFIAYILK